MTQQEFDRAIFNTMARFASTPGIEKLKEFVIFNEPKDGMVYYSIIYRDGYQNFFPQDVRDLLYNELKSLQK